MVIPALDEAGTLPALLERLAEQDPPVAETVVSDSGSADATADIAAAAGCLVVRDPAVTGRGSALAAGVAAVGTADAVWMVHADCLPPLGATAAIGRALRDPGVVGGAFGQRFNTRDCKRWARHRLRLVVWFNRLRYRLTGTHFGDQGIFVRPAALAAIGGIPPMDLFEDVELVRSLRRLGRVVLLPERMTTSPRRFLKNGPIRQLLRDAWMLTRHRTRGGGERYAAAYGRRRG